MVDCLHHDAFRVRQTTPVGNHAIVAHGRNPTGGHLLNNVNAVRQAGTAIPESAWSPSIACRKTFGKRCATYPANLCPFLFGAEFSDREEDLGDAVGQAVEDATFTAIGKRTAEHFQHVLCGLE